MISPVFIEALKKGAISLAWRVLFLVITGIIAIIGNSLNLLNLSPEIVAFIGLILGEISKQVSVWEKTKLGVARRLGKEI